MMISSGWWIGIVPVRMKIAKGRQETLSWVFGYKMNWKKRKKSRRREPGKRRSSSKIRSFPFSLDCSGGERQKTGRDGQTKPGTRKLDRGMFKAKGISSINVTSWDPSGREVPFL